MARPIKETPTLTGKDAKRFLEKMEQVDKRRISKEEYDKLMADYEEIKKLSRF
ncbi:MAG: hypothetical protein HQK99_08085 [Nitrospirae bacterium]|nr:hypothetical protein [Nitrospirota bacterium]